MKDLLKVVVSLILIILATPLIPIIVICKLSNEASNNVIIFIDNYINKDE